MRISKARAKNDALRLPAPLDIRISLGFSAAARLRKQTHGPSAAPASSRGRSRIMDERRRCFPLWAGSRRNTRPVVAGLFALFAAFSAPASAGALCKPTLTFGPAHFSEMASAQRLWSARLNVDASRCASTSGRFGIDFVRLIEFGP